MRSLAPLLILAAMALAGCSSDDDDGTDLSGGWQVFACPVTNATADNQVRVDYPEAIPGGVRQSSVTLMPGETRRIQVGRYGAGSISVHITILYLGRHYEEDRLATPAGVTVEDHLPGSPG